MSRTVVLFDAYPNVFGGSQRITHLLAREAPDVGWDPIVLTPGRGLLTERLAADGVRHEVLEAPPALSRYGHTTNGWARVRAIAALPAYWVRVGRRLRALHADVLHVADARGIALTGVAAQAVRTPVTWHVHLTEPEGFPTVLATKLATAVVVPSRLALADMPGLERARRLEEIPNPVSAVATRTEPITLTTSPRLVTLARLLPAKGIDVLLDALPRIRDAVPGTTAAVVGGPSPGFPEEPARIAEHATRLGVADAVELPGFVDSPEDALARGRVYVQPSRHEVRPLAILEAMTLGLPIVATDVGGVRDLVEPDVTGLLVPPDDPGALARAVIRVLQDADLADRLRRAAFARANSDAYGVDRFIERVTSVWEDVRRRG